MKLVDFYAPDGPERVGFILRSGEIVEVKNVSNDPLNAFAVEPEELIRLEDEMVASWHTHPGVTSNLSGDDYAAFKSWPDLLHYIIGKGGVTCYSVTASGAVVKNETPNCPSWSPEKAGARPSGAGSQHCGRSRGGAVRGDRKRAQAEAGV